MKYYFKSVTVVFFVGLLLIQSVGITEHLRYEVSIPSVDEAAANFSSPPVEYGMTFYWGWDGNVTEEVIARDLDAFRDRNVHQVTLEPGYRMNSLYLSEGWFNSVRKAVDLAKERNMRIWLVDEGKYPSGFAGGKFTAERPDLRMQALVQADPIRVGGGQSVSRRLSPETVGAVAVRRGDNHSEILEVSSGELNWTAPEGDWQVLVIEHQFRSSPTRAVNNPSGGKDTSNSLCDYLDSAATKQFLDFTHEQYKKVVGDEFGKTVLGFRGDEPDYSIRGIPWTPKLFEEFKRRKGYDIQAYAAAFFIPEMTEEQKRIKADYWDVWSGLFGENFFSVQAEWCREHNLQYLVHLNKEDDMIALVAHEGDFFKTMRHVQMPGVDAIWNQIWPGTLADFPKYASSVAHVYGKPRSFTESFAAYRTEPNVVQAKWVLDHQFARGINMVEVMFVPASSRGRLGLSGWLLSESFPATAAYINRASYLLSQGRPAAQIAVYHPTTSLWLGDNEANKSVLDLMQGLLERQRDFDFVDEYALQNVLTVEPGSLINRSGQTYRAVIVPPVSAMSKGALQCLRAFADSGGQVVFLGSGPALMPDKTFLHAGPAPSLDWAMAEPSGTLTDRVLAALPEPDVKLDSPCTFVKYTHRRLKDADLYFFFNESDEPQPRKVTLAGSGTAHIWDAMTGKIQRLENAVAAEGRVQLPLELEPYGIRFIVVGPAH